jgi:hypothetical protein
VRKFNIASIVVSVLQNAIAMQKVFEFLNTGMPKFTHLPDDPPQQNTNNAKQASNSDAPSRVYRVQPN